MSAGLERAHERVRRHAFKAKYHHFFLFATMGRGRGDDARNVAALILANTVYASQARAVASAERAGATLLITADHGNCEVMIDPMTGGPHTAHTTNTVPFVMVGEGIRGPLRHGGSLRDVGPTVLRLLGVDPPPEMTGRDLREES